ncbi:type II toxin-antitoxin system VapC family toxin [Georgenia subflava]|uniref:Ribonuclease VapC n=1 Tax=Georgenia subflava TaxID=1622177 RepID=A0A6N7ELT2_9MICO|nr:type II toxin-antitoxin system VapC family toxin [Georgenia subflava]MPV39079.1 PIN domain-containing protein [Georgenia subflava]
MLLFDVNVVLAAHRDDHPQHQAVRRWFDEVLAREQAFGVPTGVWASFLRLATNRRIFAVPTPRPEAFAFIDAVLAQPHCLRLDPGPRHLTLLRQLCDEGSAVGDLVPDAVIAALAAEHSATVATLDHDFARFPTVPHTLLATT